MSGSLQSLGEPAQTLDPPERPGKSAQTSGSLQNPAGCLWALALDGTAEPSETPAPSAAGPGDAAPFAADCSDAVHGAGASHPGSAGARLTSHTQAHLEAQQGNATGLQ